MKQQQKDSQKRRLLNYEFSLILIEDIDQIN